MKKVYAASCMLWALLLLFTGATTVEGTSSGRTDAPAALPVPAAAAVEGSVATDSIASEAAHSYEAILRHPEKLPMLPPEVIDAETLWLARCIYSETKRPQEQELVAWVVRNRVESGYRGKRTYRDVVLDPYQFSAFNAESLSRRHFYVGLTLDSKVPGWKRALSIAHHVRHADPRYRPFSIRTRHFYSERSMVERLQPGWAEGREAVQPNRPFQIEARRFRFFEGVV